MPDSLRLALGTFTRVPVPPPRVIDARVAARAMMWAPVVGAFIALVVAAAAQFAVRRLDVSTGSLLVSALTLGAAAYLTRGLHLDGLADTADALGSGRPAPEALEIARRSDIGPFGVVVLVIVLLVEVFAFAGLLDDGRALIGLVVAMGTGRLAVVIGCTRGIPAARPDGLGATVAGCVPAWASVLEVAAWTAAVWGVTVLVEPTFAASAAVAVVGALVCGALVLRVAVRRLGGITGDVLGAVIEITTCSALVILVGVPS